MRINSMTRHLLTLASILLLITACTPGIVQEKSVDITDKSAEEIVALMTLEEKLGQMTQVDRRYLDDLDDIRRYKLGSLLSGGGSTPASNEPAVWADMIDEYQTYAMATRLGIPLIYGIDAVHGHNNMVGATIPPHNIGLGATRNPDLVRELSQLTAREVRATGINWTFSPCVAVSQDERWGRTYESYSEDPALVSLLGKASVEGYQGSALDAPDAIAACAKHFVGDGGAEYGTDDENLIDRGDARVDEETLRKLHMAPYLTALDANVATIMASYSSWNGETMHGHHTLLTEVLKGELGFEGFIISDWRGIDEISGDLKTDIITGINAGLDMIMVPGDTAKQGYTYHRFLKLLHAAVREGAIPLERIDDAVTRILRVKAEMGLMNGNWQNDRALLPSVGSDEHRSLARQAVRESIVLLKNDGVLPLSKDSKRIAVIGRGADNVGMQCGGWTISWQGGMGPITPGTSILAGVRETVNEATEVIHARKPAQLTDADAVIVVVGEEPYAEMGGDREDLSLSKEDLATLTTVEASGIPYVVVLLSGRPMIVTDVIDSADAVLAAWLPGTEGNGVTDVIFGDYAPTGKLPFSWPISMEQIPVNVSDADYAPLFEYGFGLSYE